MTQILNKSNKLIEAIKILESNKRKICIVLSRGKLIGTITDGDIRRHLIKKGSLDVKVFEVMNKNPICGNMNSTSHELYKSMKRYSLLTIPIIDESKKYIKSVTLADLGNIDLKTKVLQKNSIKSVVIMAGGEGKRLMPLTKSLPKPMVEIAGIPILERQIAAFVKLNIKNIYISVGYLSNKICDYFGNGKNFGANIFYIHETIKLGTAGPLSLLPKNQKGSILVINGDIISEIDFVKMIDFHLNINSDLTIAGINHIVNIPFGVIKNRDFKVLKIQEKPSQIFLCNAGIYLISNKLIKLVPKKILFNMTDLIEKCIETKRNVCVFPIHESWHDVGTLNDLKKVNKLYNR